MMAIQSFPRASAYLAAANFRLNDPSMTDIFGAETAA